MSPRLRLVSADDPRIWYTGRVGLDLPGVVDLFYSASGLRARFEGRTLGVRLGCAEGGTPHGFGVRIDGGAPIPLRPLSGGEARDYLVAVGLEPGLHDLELHRSQDSLAGVARLGGLWIDAEADLGEPPSRPARRLEFFGDSVTGGCGSLAVGYEARPDEAVAWANGDGAMNDGYWGFAAIAARRLGAEAHVQGIGGLALLDATGWYGGDVERCVGLVSTWDRLSPVPGALTPWEFARFTPDAVVIAVGQNDARGGHVEDAAWREGWTRAYAGVIDGLRAHYPAARFVLTTTILEHEAVWDEMVGQVAAERKARHLAFRRVGRGTPGHPRLAEQEEMAFELARCLETFWEEG